ncbi:MAG: thioredoxin domain-containing protein, partial [Acidobacteriota bacterium]
AARQKLFEARKKRVHPLKDDKILTDWNGLMIASFAKAASALAEPKYAEAAANAAKFLLNRMRSADGGLLHRYRLGDAAIQGNLDDYAFLVWGLLELYQTGFDVSYLKHAIELNDYMLQHFWDEKGGGFFFTSDIGEKLLVRTKEIYDGAVPSGNSVAYMNLLRLARITGNTDLEQKAEQLERVFSQQVSQIASAHTMFLAGLDFRIGPTYEVVIAGRPERGDTAEMLVALQKVFAPNKILMFRPEGEEVPEISHLAPFTEMQKSIEGKATAYICRNYVCNVPTTNVRTAIEQIT